MPRRTKPNPRDENSFRGDREEEETSAPVYIHVTKSGARVITPTTEGKNPMSMIDPSEWNVDDSQEPYALKDGTEAQLRIIEVRKSSRDNGFDYYTVRLEVPTEPYSKEITAFLDIPSKNMEAKRLNTARNNMRNFTDAFGIDLTRPFDPTEDWLGLEAWAILSLSKSEQYGEQNRVSKWIKAR